MAMGAEPSVNAAPMAIACTGVAVLAKPHGGSHGAAHDNGARIDSDQGRSNSLIYKDMVIVTRFIFMVATALLIVASLSLGAVAATTAHAPQPHYSSMVSPDHDDCEGVVSQNVDGHGCCQGVFCAFTGVLAQSAIVAPMMLSASQPNPDFGDHLYGRLTAPETRPPKSPPE